MKKLLAVGVIVLFLGLAIAPSINANVKQIINPNLTPTSDDCREIITKILLNFNDSTKPIINWTRPIFLHRLEMWSDKPIALLGIEIRGIIPIKFLNYTKHLVAPRCLFYYITTISEERMFVALALGDIEWN